MSVWIDHIGAPVDPDIFLKMTQVWQEAARVPLPKPKSKKQGYYLTDIPMNRGALAVVGELKKQNVEHQQAYLCRLMGMGEIFKAQEFFKDFIKPDESDPSATMVSEALLKALAVAKFSMKEDQDSFDLDDVLKHANSFKQDDE